MTTNTIQTGLDNILAIINASEQLDERGYDREAALLTAAGHLIDLWMLDSDEAKLDLARELVELVRRRIGVILKGG